MPETKQLGWKAVTYGAGALATFATHRALTFVWNNVRESPPPDELGDRRVGWAPALTWAVATGVGIGVVRLVAVRSAARVWEVATNEPPPTVDAA